MTMEPSLTLTSELVFFCWHPNPGASSVSHEKSNHEVVDSGRYLPNPAYSYTHGYEELP